MSHTGVFRQKINGIKTSRFFIRTFAGSSFIFATAGPFLLTPETAIPALAVSLGGTAGSFLLGMSNGKRNSAKNVKKLTGSDVIPLKNRDLARALLGIPFEAQRTMVNHYPYQQPTAQQRLTHIVKSKVISATSLGVVPYQKPLVAPNGYLENSRVWEAENYFVSSPAGLYVEQVIKPSALTVWDEAYASVCQQFDFPMDESHQQKSLPLPDTMGNLTPRILRELMSKVDIQTISDILTNPKNNPKNMN